MTLNIPTKGTSPAAVGQPPPRSRLRFWRSPPGQPRWARPILLAIAALATLLYAWNITDSGYPPYYSVAARSMAASWKAFLFTAFDPASTLTLDKIGGFLWPQAICVRLFGLQAWALTLPQVIEGVVSVLVLYRVVRRWQGPAAGLTAAALLTVTPLAASMFGHALVDASVTMCLVLAADQGQKAMLTGRPGPLLLSGVWIGLGFQAKMIYAWIIVPALVVGYLVAAPHPLRRRLRHLLLAGAVMLSVSLSWVALMTLTPAGSRPYIDGTTNNSAFAMVFGYNGLDRVHPGLVNGTFADTGTGTASGSLFSAGPPSGTAGLPGADGWGKLLDIRFTPQIGWLYPLALLALVIGLVRLRRGPRTDPERAGYLMWGVWLACAAVVVSAVEIPHTAYLAILTPALAALSAAGITALWRTHRSARGGPWAWVLPGAVVATEVWTVHLARNFTAFAPWLIPTVIVASATACAALVYSAHSSGHPPFTHRIGLLGMILGCIAMFIAPTTWSFSVLNPKYAGSAFDAYAGPPTLLSGQAGQNGTAAPKGGPVRSMRRPGSTGSTEPSGSTTGEVQTSLNSTQKKLLAYVRRNNGSAKYAFSTDTWETAAPYIYAEALPVLPLGGWMGLSNSTTLTGYRHLVADGALRFAVLNDGADQQGPRVDGSPAAEIGTWVRSACTRLDPAVYGAGAPGPDRTQEQQSQETLYRCSTGSGSQPGNTDG